MPYDYFVRITHPYASLAPLISRWSLECEKLVAYEHVGTLTEKVHIHMVILGSRLQKKQLRNIGQQQADLKGNELCSFKECVSWEQPIVYMTKGMLEPSYNKGFASDKLIELKGRWVTPKNYEKQSVNKKYYEAWLNSDWKKLQIHVAEKKAVLEKQLAACEDGFQRDSLIVNSQGEFDAIKGYFRRYVFEDNQSIWDLQAINKYKMMVLTYCMREEISIPKNTDWAKWL